MIMLQLLKSWFIYLTVCQIIIVFSIDINSQENSNFESSDKADFSLKSNSTAKSKDVNLTRMFEIARQMDKDESGKVSQNELQEWIAQAQIQYSNNDADRHFEMHDTNKDGLVEWKEYRQNIYGFISEEQMKESDEEFSYLNMFLRDKRRWQRADEDDDKICNKSEFRIFIHPEEFEHTKDLFVKETLEDLDKDKDGFVDINEYIGDMISPNDPEPEWLVSTRKDFVENKDIDGDGKLNEDEVSAWIMPNGYSQSKAEAKHLIYTADDDRDGELSQKEIILHYDNFLMSVATEWGEMLKKPEV